MLYPLLIDGKIFPSLNLLFTADVIANLSQGPIISGLPALTVALQQSVANVDSHHNLGTQVIDYQGGCEASSVTYFHASLLGKGDAYGEVVYALGQYQDTWIRGAEGWRIGGRNLVYMVCHFFFSQFSAFWEGGLLMVAVFRPQSPFIGNASIVGG